jgi:hypothetical protein
MLTAQPYSTEYAGPYDWSPGVPDAPAPPALRPKSSAES